MKDLFFSIGKKSRIILIVGWGCSLLLVAASAVLFFGAGIIAEYYPAMYLCEKLLAASRPVFVLSSAISLSAEYLRKMKTEDQ